MTLINTRALASEWLEKARSNGLTALEAPLFSALYARREP